jgi:uncharacterized protein (TIGR02391 family)
MNLVTHLDERLWRSIQSSYESRNFTGAILDGIYFLSDLIREKTGLESDGTTLVGQAFGGKTPKLRVNTLQTESEKNIQAGIEQLMRGLYRAVRNPRSHEKYTDNQKDADAIILFTNYLLGIIDQAKTRFSKSEFLNRVFDPDFVKKARYAELLAAEVPPKQRLEVMLDLFRKKETGDGTRLSFFVSALLPKLNAQQKKEFLAAVSEELRVVNSNKTIRYILQIFPVDTLKLCAEDARMRLEGRLIESIREGTYDEGSGTWHAGALGTWATEYCEHFLLKDELVDALVSKIRSENPLENDYLLHSFWDILTRLVDPPTQYIVSLLKKKLQKGDKRFYDVLTSVWEEGEWTKPFTKEVEVFVARIPDDDIPF